LSTILNTHELLETHKINKELLDSKLLKNQIVSSFLILLIQQCDNIQSFIRAKTNFYARAMKEKQCDTFEEILEFIKMFIWDVIISGKKNDIGADEVYSLDDLIAKYKEFKDSAEKYSLNQIEEIVDNFYKFIWSRFTSPIFPNFGQKYIIQSKTTDYMILLFRGYGYYIGRIYNKVANRNSIMLQQYIESVFEENIESQIFDTDNIPNALELANTKQEFSKEDELDDAPKNPYVVALENHASELMMNMDSIEGWAGSLLELPELIQDLIFNSVWSLHGRIDGIHPDFGRMAYINSEDINPCYWLNKAIRGGSSYRSRTKEAKEKEEVICFQIHNIIFNFNISTFA